MRMLYGHGGGREGARLLQDGVVSTCTGYRVRSVLYAKRRRALSALWYWQRRERL
jgi:hypothetical protein